MIRRAESSDSQRFEYQPITQNRYKVLYEKLTPEWIKNILQLFSKSSTNPPNFEHKVIVREAADNLSTQLDELKKGIRNSKVQDIDELKKTLTQILEDLKTLRVASGSGFLKLSDQDKRELGEYTQTLNELKETLDLKIAKLTKLDKLYLSLENQISLHCESKNKETPTGLFTLLNKLSEEPELYIQLRDSLSQKFQKKPDASKKLESLFIQGNTADSIKHIEKMNASIKSCTSYIHEEIYHPAATNFIRYIYGMPQDEKKLLNGMATLNAEGNIYHRVFIESLSTDIDKDGKKRLDAYTTGIKDRALVYEDTSAKLFLIKSLLEKLDPLLEKIHDDQKKEAYHKQFKELIVNLHYKGEKVNPLILKKLERLRSENKPLFESLLQALAAIQKSENAPALNPAKLFEIYDRFRYLPEYNVFVDKEAWENL